MLGHVERRMAANRRGSRSLPSAAAVGCEALESRQLLSRGLGLGAFGGPVLVRQAGSLPAELGSFGGGGASAIFGAGRLGLGGGVRSPIFLLTASLLNTGDGSTIPPSRSVLSSSAVQSAFQALQTDLNNDVTVGERPSHATVGQLQDDLLAIRKGTLTGGAATSAIQADEAAILTSLGLSTSQVGQIQSDLQAVQSAIRSASSSGAASTTTTGSGATGTTGGSTPTTPSSTDPASTPISTTPVAGATPAAPSDPSSPSSAVTSAYQALQTDLKSDLTKNTPPTNASIGQVLDDLDAIQKGTLTGSQAVSTIQGDAASVFSGAGLTQSQIAQIQSDQAALASAIQANSNPTTGSTSSSPSSGASPTSIAAVEATLQSIQPYLIGVPGIGGPDWGGSGGQVTGGFGGPGRLDPLGQGVSFPIAPGGGPVMYRMNGSMVSTKAGPAGDGPGGYWVSTADGPGGSGAVVSATAVPIVAGGDGAVGQGTNGPVVLAVNGSGGAGGASSAGQAIANLSHGVGA